MNKYESAEPLRPLECELCETQVIAGRSVPRGWTVAYVGCVDCGGSHRLVFCPEHSPFQTAHQAAPN